MSNFKQTVITYVSHVILKTERFTLSMLIFWPKYFKSKEFFENSQFGPVCDMCYS